MAAATGEPRREVYQRALELTKESADGAARPRSPARPPAPPSPERQVAFRLGLSAESRAAAYLIAKGYRILARRWRSPAGEIDIVARRRGTLVFVEVKARARLDDAAEAGDAAAAPPHRRRGRSVARRASGRANLRHALRRHAGRARQDAAPHRGGVRRDC